MIIYIYLLIKKLKIIYQRKIPKNDFKKIDIESQQINNTIDERKSEHDIKASVKRLIDIFCDLK